MTKSVTAPLAAVGTAAVKFAADSQDAYQQFAAATGTATEEMGKYQDMINNIYKDNLEIPSAMSQMPWQKLIRICLI